MIRRTPKGSIEIEEAVNEVVEPLKLQIKTLKLTLEVVNKIGNDSARMASSFSADWKLFGQALFHPLVNAIKFNKPGGKIVITLKVKRLEGGDYVKCRIKDEGIGIAPEDIKNLFSAFKVADEDIAENDMMSMSKGIGLGLSTTKILSRVQGGGVFVKSELDLFTEVTFTTRVEEKLGEPFFP